ncbi:GtrA family protein [Enterococcus dongliensis]|uniref:GtrA family protein n=1 Tax=Enterococcus dongliensis TaxID=2559925 RepID=A0AAW8TG08_9ENTE|nr:GtrA family protein [Enterococcus dongliensis]MDT2633435.1 GtrA family protein [Enterococcus dongliensis]MDT2636786.1 GtrA family protein [Enterococcus dongliensis]MDT2641343.1 GtrA family protein [Enterococcus dongliensis]MDT2646563.1 GtrA family protein [Enterococcus dongliensis]MDT2668363.1 GtrA family protein [Enterococcus dongliensis]
MKIYHMVKEYLVAKRLWEVFIYLFFGGLATVVNIVTFALAYQVFHLNWPISNTISWIFSVLFAFVTNKVWVFQSKTENFKELVWEFSKFVFARVISFGMDMATMYLFIDLLHTGNLIAKLITQIIVVIANYIFSKVFIFKKVEIIEDEKTNSSSR